MAPTFLIGSLIYAFLGAVGFGTAGMWAGKHTSLVKVLAITAAICCWISWATVYMAQMNPLILPERNLNSE